MYWVDGLIPNETLQNSRLILSGTPGEIRTMLVGMAGTILATAGVVFTLLTLPLSTVAAQYGSRLLRVFLGDRTTQLVLGMFVATFVYCLAAALSIPPAEVEPEGPQLTATVGLFLMLASFASLILLVQHVSTMLQAPNIAAAAGAELRDVVLAEIPDEVRSGNDRQSKARPGSHRPTSLVETDGYPVRVRAGRLHPVHRSGDSVYPGEGKEPGHPLAAASRGILSGVTWRLPWSGLPIRPGTGGVALNRRGAGRDKSATLSRLEIARTPTQDVAYAVNQLVEMAVRAMSPAINDPFTAMTCLDYIGGRPGAVHPARGERRLLSTTRRAGCA